MMNSIYPWFKDAWIAIHENEKLPHALILKGKEGIGKYDFAMKFTKSYLCQNPLANHFPCEVCSSCQWFPESHPDFRHIAPIESEDDESSKRKTIRKKSIVIDQIRDLSEYLELSAHQVSGKRVVLIEPADSLNQAASNALLKILEEPPENTLFILLSSQIQKLIATIRSRCQLLDLRGPSLDEANLFLIDQNIVLEESLLSFTGGSPFNAIKELENKSEREVVTQLLSQGHNIDITKVSYAILTQGLDWTLNMIQKWAFDLLLSFHTQQSYYFTNEEKLIHSQAKQINLNALLLFTNELNELKKIASHPVNQELQLQNIFIKYKQIFEPS
ncbi:DNA polymerase III subunit delta' [Candidatus Methylopumilus rimovensis]|uniref:DNA polymerase III subunit delta' n=1 Tax=Candidatus Methylopumilus rimovensis TaxID=2588535 RepID=UPI0011214E83|nr:DNA polymerase III subunit delta' [Candidatus Methylopumilus rimovensis]QDD12168.1 DNA polymerase III subunit delta' [Candidatus Methylopumilus rimovensis]